MTKMIYLAEPIDQAPGAAILRGLVGALGQDLVAAGYNVYRPATAWSCAEVDRRVEQVNRAALDTCDAVVAHLPAGVPSIGVPMEIQFAITAGKPVVILTNIVSMSLAGSDLITPVRAVSDVVPALRDALATASGASGRCDRVRVDMLGEARCIRTKHDSPAHRFSADEPQQDTHGGVLKVMRLGEAAQLPSRAYNDDAGLDLYTSSDVIIEPGGFADIPTAIAVELPEWSWGQITGRSSTLRHRKLMVYPAVIDCGYRGPLFAAVWNLSDEPVGVKAGERIAQLIIFENATRRVTPVEAAELSAHARGSNGFGSSGA